MHARTLVAFSSVLVAPALRAQQAPDVTPYLIADRAAEIALARTAAPADVSGEATVLVLTPKGYIEAARGTNGFTCLVMRSFAAAPGDPQFWNPHGSAGDPDAPVQVLFIPTRTWSDGTPVVHP
jgi:hypothetical protein